MAGWDHLQARGTQESGCKHNSGAEFDQHPSRRILGLTGFAIFCAYYNNWGIRWVLMAFGLKFGTQGPVPLGSGQYLQGHGTQWCVRRASFLDGLSVVVCISSLLTSLVAKSCGSFSRNHQPHNLSHVCCKAAAAKLNEQFKESPGMQRCLQGGFWGLYRNALIHSVLLNRVSAKGFFGTYEHLMIK